MRPWVAFICIAAMFNLAQYFAPPHVALMLMIPVVLFCIVAGVSCVLEGRNR